MFIIHGKQHPNLRIFECILKNIKALRWCRIQFDAMFPENPTFIVRAYGSVNTRTGCFFTWMRGTDEFSSISGTIKIFIFVFRLWQILTRVVQSIFTFQSVQIFFSNPLFIHLIDWIVLWQRWKRYLLQPSTLVMFFVLTLSGVLKGTKNLKFT